MIAPRRSAQKPWPEGQEQEPPLTVGEAEFSLALDGDLVVSACNDALARWLGFPDASALVGRPLAETLDPRSRPKLEALAQLDRPRPVELNHRGRDGRLALARYHVFPPGSLGPDQARIVAFGSDRQHLLGVLEEIIDLKREREAQLARLREMNVRLERQNADLTALSHMVKHDVSNSLNALSLTGALLAYAGLPPSHVAESAGEIQSLCQHIAGILSGFVSLADVARTPLEPVKVDLGQTAKAMVTLVAGRLPNVPHLAAYDFPAPHVRADPHHVRQVIENLVSNAFKYRDPARPALELRLSSRALVGNRVMLEVADNGRGIPEDRQATVFDLFTRAHDDVEPGQGIGLAIVRRLVEANGGSISVESRPGLGSAFRVILPAAEPEPGPRREPRA